MNLSVEDITVEVPGTERVVLSGISFKLSAGTGLALLGASAAGKSSLVRALVGVWPVTKGAIRLDGAALDNWHPDGLGRHIGYLPQDVALFDGTVAENIARFDATATSDAVLDAARLAGAHEMILSLPDGYTTELGERGSALSAGQRQRIGLARAVFGNPFFVVLDEPNANLDHDGEVALIKAIQVLRQNQSIVVMVSHRPEALAALNFAMVLRAGRMAYFGLRDELLRSGRPIRQDYHRRQVQTGHNANAGGPHSGQRAVMTTIEFTDAGHAAERRPSGRRNVTAGLQGEALIIELRSAKSTLDRRRRANPPAKRTPPRPPRSTSPELLLHQFPRLHERLDQFDRSLLQEPLLSQVQ